MKQDQPMLKIKSPIRWIIITAIMFTPLQSPRAQTAPQLGRNSVKEVVAAMTLEEKVKLLVGMGFNID
jgi:beta-glucosidase